MQKPDKGLVKLANESGYFFQERLRDEVQRTRDDHGWNVIAEEHRWCDEDGAEGFIDLVLANGVLRMVVEAKRSREANWIFLVSKSSSPSTSRARCLQTIRSQNEQPQVSWSDANVQPASPEAKFCVVRGKGDRDQPMLERIGGILLRSLENLAEEELRLGVPSPHGRDQRIYFPVLVTNAKMYACFYDAGLVDLNTGELTEGECHPVEFIRFRKGLSTKWPLPPTIQDLRQSNRAKERTIFVINGSKLGEILRYWDI